MRKSRISKIKQMKLREHFVAGTTARTAARLVGGMQTFQTTLNHLDKFSYIGGFSGAGGRFGPPGAAPLDLKESYNGVFADADAFNKKVKLVFVGIGTTEPKNMHDGIVAFHEALTKGGAI